MGSHLIFGLIFEAFNGFSERDLMNSKDVRLAGKGEYVSRLDGLQVVGRNEVDK